MVFMAFMYLVPSLSSDLPPWWSSFLPREKIHLGLDLMGGMHLVLEVEAEKAVESRLERVVEDLKHDLRKKKKRYFELQRRATEGIDLTLIRKEDRQLFKELVESNYPNFEIESGSAKEKGLPLRLVLSARAANEVMKLATDQALETIRNRVDQFGVSEPDIRAQQD